MIRQLALELSPTELDTSPADRVTYEHIHVSKSTFLNGLANRVHRWFRLTPSFGPELVQEMIAKLGIRKSDVILDPFAGAGTTLIEAKLEGHQAIGFEINPLLHFVTEISLRWNIQPKTLALELGRIEREFEQGSAVSLADLAANGLSIPTIHNPTRWWRPDVLAHLLVLKRAIMETREPDLRSFLLLALVGCLVPDLTNVTLGRLQLHFVDRSSDKIDVWATYFCHAQTMISDLEALRKNEQFGDARCFVQDATDLSNFRSNVTVDAVMTSPPYPNRYSYVWNTRPHLYLFDFLSTAREASDLDKKTIGGTWGTATSQLARDIIQPLNQAVSDVVGPIVQHIRLQDNLMANYVMHYFNRLASQVLQMEILLSSRSRLAYVVGNSWIKDIYVETDVLLAEIVERLGLGYRVFDVHRFRRRHSGKKLYESDRICNKRLTRKAELSLLHKRDYRGQHFSPAL